MGKQQAQELVENTLHNDFNKERFLYFVKNLLNKIDEAKTFKCAGSYITESFRPFVKSYERIGQYTDPDNNKIDILIIYLQKEISLERARTAQRNFIARYLKDRDQKDAALVAFVSPDTADWRFSLVKMEYKFEEGKNGHIKVKEEFTPAKRWSFLVGSNENSHTAQSKLWPIIANDESNPKLLELEEAFNIEKVTKEFFEKYHDLFLRTKDALEELVASDKTLKKDFDEKLVDTGDFAKKLLGQIVFLYFLQKKGWFGVPMNKSWGDGDKKFLRTLFEEAASKGKNYFNDYLEPLFYEALAKERDDDFYSRFECRIPFLNGGLFDPINSYDWVKTFIDLPNDFFSNTVKDKKTGDIGNGVLDIFDRYNFTVKEDEPLEKEVAVDPEMLGKVFENLLEVKDRKSKGTYYTPREIVHYMCEQSLLNYLATELEGKVSKEDLEELIKFGENVTEHEVTYIAKKKNNPDYKGAYEQILPESIEKFAKEIDDKLATIKVCDPAIGSGAFPVGMMSEIVKARAVLSTYIKDKNRTAYNFKRDCIQNSLYGVDIDPGAVEIAKLRLWLSLVVDEDDIKEIKPLPNLDYKIMQGNSLLEEFEGIKLFDEKLLSRTSKQEIENKINQINTLINENDNKRLKFYEKKPQWMKNKKLERPSELLILENEQEILVTKKKVLINELKDVVIVKKQDELSLYQKSRSKSLGEDLKRMHSEFFEATHKSKKDNIKKQIEQLEWELIEATLKEQNKTSALKKLEEFRRSNIKPFFLWKLNFADVFEEKGGFDVVIANPPYVFTREGDFDVDSKKYIYDKFLRHLTSSQVGHAKQSGKINLYAIFILQSQKLLKIGGFLTYIIPNTLLRATVYDAIRKYILDNIKIINITDLSSGVFDNVTASTVLLFLENNHANLDDKILIQAGLPGNNDNKVSFVNQESFNNNISYTFNIFSNNLTDAITHKLITKGQRLDIFVNILAGGIATGPGKKDYISDTPLSLLYKPLIEGKDVKQYRLNFNNKFILYDKKKLYRAREEKLFLKKEKLITQRIGGGKYPLIVAYDDKQFYTFNSTNSIFLKEGSPVSLKYILALLNSKLLNWFYTVQFTNKSSLTVNISKTFLEQLPIINSKGENIIIDLVDDILKLTKDKNYIINTEKQTKVRELKHQIDELVYKLYSLTDKDIKIIEGN